MFSFQYIDIGPTYQCLSVELQTYELESFTLTIQPCDLFLLVSNSLDQSCTVTY